MRKIIVFAAAAILVFGLASCAQTPTENEPAETSSSEIPAEQSPQQTDASAAQSPAEINSFESPMQLFEEAYNPFYDIQWPDGYTVYQASYEESEYNLYRLYLTAEDTAENVVNYCSVLVGDDAEESILQNLDSLNNTGGVSIHGTQVDGGLNADLSIEPTDLDDSHYEFVDGYAVTLVMGINADNTADYQRALDANFNKAAVGALTDYIDLANPVSRTVTVNSVNGFIQSTRSYSPADYDTLKLAISSDDAWAQCNDIEYNMQYGDIVTAIIFDDENQILYLDEYSRDTSKNIADYVPADDDPVETLKNMGFENFETQWSYQTDSVWLCVCKHEWGNAENVIKCAFEIFSQPCFVIINYPEQLYTVMIGEEDECIDYVYDAFADTVTPSDFFESYDTFKAAFKAMTGETSDLSVTEPVMFVDNFTFETFGYKPERLFELPTE